MLEALLEIHSFHSNEDQQSGFSSHIAHLLGLNSKQFHKLLGQLWMKLEMDRMGECEQLCRKSA